MQTTIDPETIPKFTGYKATFTNSETGESFPCWVMNGGTGTDRKTGFRIPTFKIRIRGIAGQTDFGRIIRKYGAPKWVRATSVTR